MDSVSKKYKIDRRKFGDFIENWKDDNGLGPSDTIPYKDLEKLAEEFKELWGVERLCL